MSESKIRRKSKTYPFTMFTATASCAGGRKTPELPVPPRDTVG
jgi:hypothetical protein